MAFKIIILLQSFPQDFNHFKLGHVLDFPKAYFGQSNKKTNPLHNLIVFSKNMWRNAHSQENKWLWDLASFIYWNYNLHSNKFLLYSIFQKAINESPCQALHLWGTKYYPILLNSSFVFIFLALCSIRWERTASENITICLVGLHSWADVYSECNAWGFSFTLSYT